MNILISKTNAILLLLILIAIGFATKIYLQNSIVEKELVLAELREERLIQKKNDSIANARVTAW